MYAFFIWWLKVLGSSWVVISGVLSPLLWAISTVTLLITLLITAHEPPSRACGKMLVFSLGIQREDHGSRV